MEKYDIYKDIAERTRGDIYIGVVGPVRTGKSTFITKFMETLVLPNISNKHQRERTQDELPQSADGKTIMTTQPKFIPGEAVSVQIRDKVDVNVRMIDCVGYLIDGAIGQNEGNEPRKVKTPWSENDMPFEKAAEIGTQKVIEEHSTIGILVTSDGSITEIDRGNYIKAEERVVRELKDLNKPFVVVLNSKSPNSEATVKLRSALEEKYQVPVLALNVAKLNMEDINNILERILFEFPLREVEIELPRWMQALPYEDIMITEIVEGLKEKVYDYSKMKDFSFFENLFNDSVYINSPQTTSVSLGEGMVNYEIKAKEGIFYKILSRECGCDVNDEFELLSALKGLINAKGHYEKLKNALEEVKEIGYGVVCPTIEEMKLEEPQIVKSGGKYGVRLKASAPSLHIMKVDIDTEICPIVGTEEQSEEIVKSLLSDFENNPQGLWETNMFGKSLHMLVKDGLNTKISSMPKEAQNKMRKTVGRIVNEGKGGVICILL